MVRNGSESGGGAFNYGPVGLTCPGDVDWGGAGSGYREYEKTVVVGHGEVDWRRAAEAVMGWEVKQRSGFRVEPQGGATLRVTSGADFRITAAFGPFAIHEPVRVVAVVDTLIRCGFAYGTLPGHPVSGEEAFIVHRSPDGTVALTLRSLTRPAPDGVWRALFPVLLVAQRRYRRRCLRALVPR
ncbi:MAG: hypothetical protein JWN03_5871 [Nocardia sp.]|uniref:DUF1990 family protein n=1 Tax=Nocardia sp. TaxID=1821 RepID=UPI00262D4360|nr:DUF1990 domain-containing protein [Nocardia sp.]MCU1645596.1 hypothetical protein [Nocardia sp.]